MKKIKQTTLAVLCCVSIGFAVAGMAACGESAPQKFNVTYAGDGVTATQPIVVEKDGFAAKPDDPTREHYIFDGWYNGETKWDFAVDKVTENLTLTAKWTAIEYVVKFVDVDMETVVAEKTYTIENVSAFEAPAVPDAPEHCVNGRWSKTPEEYLTFSTTPVVVAPLYDYAQYNVVFKDGENTVDTKTVYGGFNVEKPADLSKEHYTFDGWYNGDTKWDFTNDVVESDGLVLTAKWTAVAYTIIFNDYNGNEYQTLTYTVESKDSFAFPEFPTLPDGCTNPSWDKALEDCLVFSSQPIVVTAICERAPVMVYFANTAMEIPAEEVAWGEKLSAPTAPEMDGYVFKGWTLNGEAFDFENTQIKTETTLVASWVKLVDEVFKSEISAEDVKAGSVCDAMYISKNEVKDNPNGQVGGWYQDTDYLVDYVIGKAENVYDKWFQFGITVNGSNGTSETDVERVVTLPKVNYTNYVRVEFAFTVGGAPTVKVYGNDIPYGKTGATNSNKVAIITTEADGVYIEIRETNDGPAGAQCKYKLPDAVARGEEGIAFTFLVKGWIPFQLSEFHVWSSQLDYQAKMSAALAQLPQSVEGLTYSDEERAIAAEYLIYAAYMTDYEKTLPEPEVITALKTGIVTLDVNGQKTEIKGELGKPLPLPVAAAPEGYAFKGWMKDGALYDVNTPVDGNFTLVASWYAISTKLTQTVMSAEDVKAGSIVDPYSVSKEAVGAMPDGADKWFYNTDYVRDWTGSPERLLDRGFRFGITVDGGGGSSATPVARKITLPAINYMQYNRVDFGFTLESASNLDSLTAYGLNLKLTKANGSIGATLLSVEARADGAYLVVRLVNEAAVLGEVKLPDYVATGTSGIVFNASVKGWVGLILTEFHLFSNKLDYTAKMSAALAKLPQSVEDLTHSDAEKALAAEYLTYAAYMTDYEKSVYVEPAVITALKA